MNPRRLYRSARDRKLAGIAAGMADYFDLDPTLVRILWIVSVFFGGFTILLYIILAFVIPIEPATMPGPGSWQWQPAGPPWGAPPTRSAGTDPTGGAAGGVEGSGSVDGPGAGSAPDGGATRPGWPAPWPDQQPDGRRGGQAGLYLGILLVVFGAIAMAGTLFPTWIGARHLGPALIVAVGIVLLVGSIRRSTSAQ